MKMNYLYLFFLITIVSGCSTVKLKPGAEKIRLTNSEPSHCTFLGQIHGNQDGSSVIYSRGNDLEIGAENDMKNKAFELGADTIHLLSKGKSSTSVFSLMGNAYKCHK